MAKVHQKLLKIQGSLKVPKAKLSDYGGYHYRSLEDIIEAAKPLMDEHGVALLISDNIEHIEGRFYVKATATLVDIEDGECVSVESFAREAQARKKMDDAQVTGAASSYARKYALCGLLAIDGQDDIDDLGPDEGDPKQGKKGQQGQQGQNNQQNQRKQQNQGNQGNQQAQQNKQGQQGQNNGINVILGRQSNFIKSGVFGFRTVQFHDQKIGWIMTVNPELTEKLAELKSGITKQVIGEVVPDDQKTEEFPKDTLKDRVFMVADIV